MRSSKVAPTSGSNIINESSFEKDSDASTNIFTIAGTSAANLAMFEIPLKDKPPIGGKLRIVQRKRSKSTRAQFSEDDPGCTEIGTGASSSRSITPEGHEEDDLSVQSLSMDSGLHSDTVSLTSAVSGSMCPSDNGDVQKPEQSHTHPISNSGSDFTTKSFASKVRPISALPDVDTDELNEEDIPNEREQNFGSKNRVKSAPQHAKRVRLAQALNTEPRPDSGISTLRGSPISCQASSNKYWLGTSVHGAKHGTVASDLLAPPKYRCSLSGKVMRCPVKAQDGYVYEKAAILEWLHEFGTSPKTGEAIGEICLRVDLELQCKIRSWKARRKEQKRKIRLELSRGDKSVLNEVDC